MQSLAHLYRRWVDDSEQYATVTDLAVLCTLNAIATVAVGLRLWVIRLIQVSISWDVLVLLFSLLLCYAQLIFTIAIGAIEGVTSPRLPFERQLDLDRRIDIINPFFGVTASAATKISVLLFYKTVFRPHHAFRVCCNALIAVISAWCVCYLVGLMISNPIVGHLAFNGPGFVLAMYVVGMALDFVTLTLPLPLICRLRMPMRRRIQIATLICIGLCPCAAAVVRLYYGVMAVLELRTATGPYYHDYYAQSIFLWIRIEPIASIIAACVPTYGPLLKYRHCVRSLLHSIGSKFRPSRVVETKPTKEETGEFSEATDAAASSSLAQSTPAASDTGSDAMTARPGACPADGVGMYVPGACARGACAAARESRREALEREQSSKRMARTSAEEETLASTSAPGTVAETHGG